jgi:RNA polymerase sigma factor (sigma-70 family)
MDDPHPGRNLAARLRQPNRNARGGTCGQMTSTGQEAHMTSTTTLAPPSVPRVEQTGNPIAGIVGRAARGDRVAFADLVEEFQGLLWAIARGHRLSEADAADVVQTTWLRLLQNLERIEDPSRVGAWLATTARRECLRKLRSCAREIPSEEPPEPSPGQAQPIDGRLLEAERDAALWSGFGRLGSRDQMLLRMLVADPQPSYEEIGAALDMPIGSIGPTRARALERLRRELERGEALFVQAA